MKFSELNDQQKAKAIEELRYINVDNTDYDIELRGDFINKMKEYGFEDIELMVDVSCTQGSGASFNTKSVDIEKYLRKVKHWSQYRSLHELILSKDLECTIERNGQRYVHSNTVGASIETWNLDLTSTQENLVQKLEDEITDFVRSECDDIHSSIENLMLDYISDESVKNTIEANEMEFEITDFRVVYL